MARGTQQLLTAGLIGSPRTPLSGIVGTYKYGVTQFVYEINFQVPCHIGRQVKPKATSAEGGAEETRQATNIIWVAVQELKLSYHNGYI